MFNNYSWQPSVAQSPVQPALQWPPQQLSSQQGSVQPS